MTLTVLSVAYPFAPVTEDPVGGAEQVLARLDRALVEAGARSIVLAEAGSVPRGELVPLPRLDGELDEARRRDAHASVRRRIAEIVARERPDVVHLHGVDFAAYLPGAGPPVMATMHLPLSWYPETVLALSRPDLWLVPVSEDQVRRGPAAVRLTRPITNGVDLEAFAPARKHSFALALGRICPEKGFHLALDAARRADMPMLLAGSVFPYPEHERYFAEEIAPRLDRRRRWIGPVTGPAKRRLIAAARCLIVSSLAPETSSLVAREAQAAGTPVAALRNGALGEAVEHGVTGVLVDDPAGLDEAILAASRLEPEACRQAARLRFDAREMAKAYLDAYGRLARGQALELAPSAPPQPAAA